MQRPYNADFELLKRVSTEEAEKIDEKIKSGKYGSYEKMKLYEQKFMPGLFSNIYSMYSKYNSPW